MNRLYILFFFILFLSCQSPPNTCVLEGTIDGFENGTVSIINISDPSNRNEILDSSKITNGMFLLDIGEVEGNVPMSVAIRSEDNQKSIGGLFLASNHHSKVNIRDSKFSFSGNYVQDTMTRITNILVKQAVDFEKFALSDPDSLMNLSNDMFLFTNELLTKHDGGEFEQFAYSIATQYLALNFGDAYYSSFLSYCEEKTDTIENIWKFNFCQQLDRVTAKIEGTNLDPSFTLLDYTDQEVSLEKYKGKVVLLDFWASWCGPCIKGFPRLKELKNKYADQGFDIIGISVDRNQSSWLKAVENHNLPWEQLIDSSDQLQSLAKRLNVGPIPRYILINRENKISHFDLNSDDLERAIVEQVSL